MSPSTDILLNYVCPAGGVLFSILVYTAPYKVLRDAVKRGDLGELNPTPWVFMMATAMGWCSYGILKQNLYIFLGNAPGVLIGVYMNLCAVKLLYHGHHRKAMNTSMANFLEESCRDLEAAPVQTQDQEEKRDWARIVWEVTSQTTPARTPHETMVLIIVALWFATLSFVGFSPSLSDATHQAIVGTVTQIMLISFFLAPLSTIMKVVRQRNAASIHVRSVGTNTAKAVFWMTYGFALSDPFLYVSNVIGVGLGAVQISLVIIFWNYTSDVKVVEEQDISTDASTRTSSELTKSGSADDLASGDESSTSIDSLTEVELDNVEAVIPDASSSPQEATTSV